MRSKAEQYYIITNAGADGESAPVFCCPIIIGKHSQSLVSGKKSVIMPGGLVLCYCPPTSILLSHHTNRNYTPSFIRRKTHENSMFRNLFRVCINGTRLYANKSQSINVRFSVGSGSLLLAAYLERKTYDSSLGSESNRDEIKSWNQFNGSDSSSSSPASTDVSKAMKISRKAVSRKK